MKEFPLLSDYTTLKHIFTVDECDIKWEAEINKITDYVGVMTFRWYVLKGNVRKQMIFRILTEICACINTVICKYKPLIVQFKIDDMKRRKTYIRIYELYNEISPVKYNVLDS